MANLTINEKLFERLRNLAQRNNRPIEELAESLLERSVDSIDDEPNLKTRDERYEEAQREVRPKIYAKARRYWKETGNIERLALTDEELDEQFWLIDPEGIPRLKSEQDSIALPPDLFLAILKIAEENHWSSGRSDISENFSDIVGDMIAEDMLRYRAGNNGGE